MEKYYDVFHRTWWRWEDERRIPGVGKRHYLAYGLRFFEARALCERWNASHEPGRLSNKAEFEESEEN